MINFIQGVKCPKNSLEQDKIELKEKVFER